MNPDVLRWARESAGLSLAKAAGKLQIKPARGFEPIARLRNLEAGREFPTRAMLANMADKYQQSLISLYVDEPPELGHHATDFRTTVNREFAEEEEAWLNLLLRDLTARQSLLKEAIIDNEEDESVSFVGGMGSRSVLDAVEELRKILGVTHREYRLESNRDQAFRLLRTRTEEAGVFVLLVGELGHHSRTISVSVFRGLVLCDEIAPMVVVNPGDSYGARSFTLLHELVHLCLGNTGVSNWTPAGRVEQFCSDVASRFLLPDSDLDELATKQRQGEEEWISEITSFAGRMNLSPAMVAYRLHRRAAISRDVWISLRKNFYRRWQMSRSSGGGGGSYYNTARYRLGNRFVGTTGRLMQSGVLTTTKAGFVLGVRPNNAHRLVEP
ncbi:ImmA/IrrE family metallo-endopeptidase [Candidatus Palauibacter sp.]|uniref:ImmA/IrrE family metallo-endopeptidase n=1 Tax=Candidatus Palauibacter sp. TaxID=3101350 RepID=UPI003B5CE5C9